MVKVSGPMPVTHDMKIEPISEDEFRALDYEVMSVAFSIHNDLGRFYEERIYRNELGYRCMETGLGTVATEVPIRVSYQDFEKFYFMDMVIDDRVVYELKTAEAITSQHKNQALNYLLLVGMQHGKIVNMRPPSVQSFFISTRLTPEKRKEFEIRDKEWKDIDGESLWLRDLLIELMIDWGVFLDIALFYDAIDFFGKERGSVVGRVEVFTDSRLVGTQKVFLLNPEIAINISAVTRGVAGYKEHLSRFLNHTTLKAIQWINFNHSKVQFTTVAR